MHIIPQSPGLSNPGLGQIREARRDAAAAEGGRSPRAAVQPVHHDARHPGAVPGATPLPVPAARRLHRRH